MGFFSLLICGWHTHGLGKISLTSLEKEQFEKQNCVLALSSMFSGKNGIGEQEFLQPIVHQLNYFLPELS